MTFLVFLLASYEFVLFFYTVTENGCDRNLTPVWLNFCNAFIPLDKMNSGFIRDMEVNQTGAVAHEIE